MLDSCFKDLANHHDGGFPLSRTTIAYSKAENEATMCVSANIHKTH